MKRLIFGSLVICLLALSGGFLVMARTNAHAAHQPGVKPAAPVSISSQRLKELVRQTLGQQAADKIGRRITQPLSISPSTQMQLPLLNQSKKAAASRSQASAREYYGNSPDSAVYETYTEGVRWVQGAGGFFNVPTANSNVQVVTEIAVGTSDDSQQISLGVDKGDNFAVLSLKGVNTWLLFPIYANDQMDAEIYLDQNTNKWLLFIEDQTTGDSYGYEYDYTTSTTIAGWGVAVSDGGPVPPMMPITFTNAQWFGSGVDWQPITSSAASSYAQWTLVAPNGGVISPTEVPTPPGTSFSLIDCPTCSS